MIRYYTDKNCVEKIREYISKNLRLKEEEIKRFCHTPCQIGGHVVIAFEPKILSNG